MSHAIQSITVNDLLDKRLVQRNGTCARKISIGNNWNTLDIGIRWASTDLGFSPGQGNALRIGLMSNPSADVANGPAGAMTSHFVGVVLQTTTGVARTTTPIPHYTSFAGVVTKRVGSTNTTAGGISFGRMPAVPTVRTLLILRIAKGSPNFTVNGVTQVSLVDALVDTSKELLIQAMEIEEQAARNAFLGNSLGIATNAYGGTATEAVAVDEDTHGPLNAIVLSWNRSAFPMIYSDVMWAQMA